MQWITEAKDKIVSNLVSIIVANYNNSKYLDDCLWSIENQTVSNWEAIIVDDGSTDSSKNIIKKYIDLDSRFHSILLPSNKGVSAARNIGLDACGGDFVTFLDSDDCMAKNTIETLYNTAIHNNADCVKSQRLKVAEEFQIRNIQDVQKQSIENTKIIIDPALTLQEWYKDPMFVWLYMLNRKVLTPDIRFVEKLFLGEDINFIMHLLPKIKTLAIIDLQTVFYRKSATSITHNYKMNKRTMLNKKMNLEMVFDFLSDNEENVSKEYEQLCKKIVVDLSMFDLFYIPLKYEPDYRDIASANLRRVLQKYNIMKGQSFLTRMAIQLFAKKKYKLSKLLIRNYQLQKHK